MDTARTYPQSTPKQNKKCIQLLALHKILFLFCYFEFGLILCQCISLHVFKVRHVHEYEYCEFVLTIIILSTQILIFISSTPISYIYIYIFCLVVCRCKCCCKWNDVVEKPTVRRIECNVKPWFMKIPHKSILLIYMLIVTRFIKVNTCIRLNERLFMRAKS